MSAHLQTLIQSIDKNVLKINAFQKDTNDDFSLKYNVFSW